MKIRIALGILIAVAACSKKDVRNDEPLITADDSASYASETATPAAAPAETAGFAATTPNELQTIYFPFDSSTLTQTARDSLTGNAAWLKMNPQARIQIEGHCDERGTTEYNIALGERRAMVAREYLTKLGVSAERLSTISYGEERPQESGHDEDAWSRNRRAVFAALN